MLVPRVSAETSGVRPVPKNLTLWRNIVRSAPIARHYPINA